MIDADLLIAGGGPVGLYAALVARRAGMRVVVAEPRSGPIDKACGEGLMPGAVAALAGVGVHPNGMPIGGFRYTDGRRSVEHRLRGAGGLGVRRTELSVALADAARDAGVEFVAERVGAISQDDAAVSAAGVRAPWLLGCDGLHSSVRRTVGLERPHGQGRRFGLRRHYRLEPWSDLVEVHWGKSIEAYVTPVGSGAVGVAVLGPRGAAYEESLAEVPELENRLRGGEPADDIRGAGPLRQRTRGRVAGRVLLAGDASGYVDALTGEGMRVGFAQADAAIAALAAGTPAAYERQWAARTRDFRVLTGALVTAATSPLRRAIVPTAVALPGLYGGFVERLAR
ncbi:MAG: dependent oxidoreductase [Naasia sp.]|nr:dependent oxidoreductase [Naasia sp.]